MNFRPVFHLLSYMIMFVAVAILSCCLVGFLTKDEGRVILQMGLSGLLAGLIAAITWALTRGPVDLTRRDGFGIVCFGWIFVAIIGGLPYELTGAIPDPVDAVFETMSGFTTTGASILQDFDELPKCVLFWRSLTQWIGGMGVLLLCVAILPFLGIGGMQIYRAEMPGPSKDRLTPRIANTAKLLYGVYVLMTVIQTLLLKVAGMSWFDAVNHALCTVSTGGFSTHSAGPGFYDSHAIEIILIVFMILGSINFALHYRALHGDFKPYLRNSELKFYLFLGAVATAFLAGNLLLTKTYTNFGEGLLDASFQMASVISTTGFATADYNAWPLLSKMILFVLMFSGGCAGSTTGGVKVIRSLVILRKCIREIRIFMQPQAVIKVKLGKQSVDHSIVAAISAFVLAFILIFAIGTFVMVGFTPDLATAASATIACLGNIGPGFGAVGPMSNFADLPSFGKLFLTLFMLLGRLELFTVLIVFYPAFWKR